MLCKHENWSSDPQNPRIIMMMMIIITVMVTHICNPITEGLAGHQPRSRFSETLSVHVHKARIPPPTHTKNVEYI